MPNEPTEHSEKPAKKSIKVRQYPKHFGKLIFDNLKHAKDKEYTPQVDPGFEVAARILDKTPAAIVTMLVQAITGRNLLGGELASFKFNENAKITGRTLMGMNRGSYAGYLYLVGALGKDAVSLIWKTVRELSLDPVYEGLNTDQLYQAATLVVLYTLSWTITIFQTTHDRAHLYQKYKKYLPWVKDKNITK